MSSLFGFINNVVCFACGSSCDAADADSKLPKDEEHAEIKLEHDEELKEEAKQPIGEEVICDEKVNSEDPFFTAKLFMDEAIEQTPKDEDPKLPTTNSLQLPDTAFPRKDSGLSPEGDEMVATNTDHLTPSHSWMTLDSPTSYKRVQTLANRFRGVEILRKYDYYDPNTRRTVVVAMGNEEVHRLPDDEAESCCSDAETMSESGASTNSVSPRAPKPADNPPTNPEPSSPMTLRKSKHVARWAVIVGRYLYVRGAVELHKFQKEGASFYQRRRSLGIKSVMRRNREEHKKDAVNRESAQELKRYMQLSSVRDRAQGVILQAGQMAKRIGKEFDDTFDADWPEDVMTYLFGTEYLDTIMLLASATRRLLSMQPILATTTVPCRIVGDLHGQLRDLILLFRAFGPPSAASTGSPTFVFNGDFVDRGAHQLEVVGLLFAFKLMYPERVFLLRGNHEEKSMNRRYGFEEECHRVLGRKWGMKAFDTIHKAFDYLPLACVVSDRILVVHGGIGDGKWSLPDLWHVKRPLQEDDLHNPRNHWIWNILWSDPIPDDEIRDSAHELFGVHSSPRCKTAVRFGFNVTQAFCAMNGLSLVVRSHQCTPNGKGFEVMHDDMLMHVFSARDYEDMGNDGAVLIVRQSEEDPNMLTVRPQVLCSITKARERANAQLRAIREAAHREAAARAAKEGGDVPMQEIKSPRPCSRGVSPLTTPRTHSKEVAGTRTPPRTPSRDLVGPRTPSKDPARAPSKEGLLQPTVQSTQAASPCEEESEPPSAKRAQSKESTGGRAQSKESTGGVSARRVSSKRPPPIDTSTPTNLQRVPVQEVVPLATPAAAPPISKENVPPSAPSRTPSKESSTADRPPSARRVASKGASAPPASGKKETPPDTPGSRTPSKASVTSNSKR